MLYIIVKVLLLILAVSIPLWIVTRRSRAEFRRRFGRTPTDAELDDLGSWLKDTPEEEAERRLRQPPPQATLQTDGARQAPDTSFGAGPRA